MCMCVFVYVCNWNHMTYIFIRRVYVHYDVYIILTNPCHLYQKWKRILNFINWICWEGASWDRVSTDLFLTQLTVIGKNVRRKSQCTYVPSSSLMGNACISIGGIVGLPTTYWIVLNVCIAVDRISNDRCVRSNRYILRRKLPALLLLCDRWQLYPLRERCSTILAPCRKVIIGSYLRWTICSLILLVTVCSVRWSIVSQPLVLWL